MVPQHLRVQNLQWKSQLIRLRALVCQASPNLGGQPHISGWPFLSQLGTNISTKEKEKWKSKLIHTKTPTCTRGDGIQARRTDHYPNEPYLVIILQLCPSHVPLHMSLGHVHGLVVILQSPLQLDDQGVSLSVFGLQLLDGAETAESAVYHDG